MSYSQVTEENRTLPDFRTRSESLNRDLTHFGVKVRTVGPSSLFISDNNSESWVKTQDGSKSHEVESTPGTGRHS